MNSPSRERVSKMVLLAILDGFGLRTESENNAVVQAKTPTLQRLLKTCPNVPIDGSGVAVGLPPGQMGNSEVGHMNIGAGRVVCQHVTRIDGAIADGSFFSHSALCASLKALKSRGAALHLLGLTSDGGVHSSLEHVRALLKLSAMMKLPEVYVHAFTDGRDTPPNSALKYLQSIQGFFDEYGLGNLASVMGRYWAMDRDRRWERTQVAYDTLVSGRGRRTDDILESVRSCYDSGETDEFIKPLTINQPEGVNAKIKKGDLVICFNFRADRMRQICYYLTGSALRECSPPEAIGIDLLTMTEYDNELSCATVLYSRKPLKNLLGEVISDAGLKQLRISETEKYSHVTYFFNGGHQKPFAGEERIMIASPKVATYDIKPEMSIVEVTDTLCEKIRSRAYDVIILNYANPDMVGHTGELEAAIQAVEAVDENLARALEALDEVGGDALITSDHGNCEFMFDPNTNGPHTAHTTNLVPLIFYGPNKGRFESPRTGGVLADIAPTILELLGITQPAEMTGESFACRVHV